MTRTRHRLGLGVAAVLAVLIGCEVQCGDAENRVAAWVNTRPINEEQVKAKTGWILKQLKLTPKSPRYKEFMPKIRAKALSMLVDREIALTSKKALAITVTADDEKARLKDVVDEKGLGDLERLKSIVESKGIRWEAWLREMKGRMIISQIKASLAEACDPCTKQEAQSLYDNETPRFQSGGRVKVSIILLDPRHVEADNFRQFVTAVTDRVRDAAATEWLVCSRKYSSGPSAETGGHWDWKDPSQLPEGVRERVGAMKPEGVVKVPVGDFVYILRLDAIEPKVQLTFDKARKDVEAEVMRRKAASAWTAWFAAEKRIADIRINKR